MALFYVTLKRDSVSLLKFLFLVQIFSYAITPACLLKYPHSCFSFQFCLLVFYACPNVADSAGESSSSIIS